MGDYDGDDGDGPPFPPEPRDRWRWAFESVTIGLAKARRPALAYDPRLPPPIEANKEGGRRSASFLQTRDAAFVVPPLLHTASSVKIFACLLMDIRADADMLGPLQVPMGKLAVLPALHHVLKFLKPAVALTRAVDAGAWIDDSILASFTDADEHRLARLACAYGHVDVLRQVLSRWIERHGATKARAIIDAAPCRYETACCIDLYDWGDLWPDFDPSVVPSEVGSEGGIQSCWYVVQSHTLERQQFVDFFVDRVGSSSSVSMQSQPLQVLGCFDTFQVLNRPLAHCCLTLDEVHALAVVLHAGADVNAVDCNGRGPMHSCAFHSVGYASDCANLLLETPGVDVMARTAFGETVLHSCAAKQNESLLDVVLEHLAASGAGRYDKGVDVGDKDGVTPLFRALQGNSFCCARRLVEAGASPFALVTPVRREGTTSLARHVPITVSVTTAVHLLLTHAGTAAEFRMLDIFTRDWDGIEPDTTRRHYSLWQAGIVNGTEMARQWLQWPRKRDKEGGAPFAPLLDSYQKDEKDHLFEVAVQLPCLWGMVDLLEAGATFSNGDAASMKRVIRRLGETGVECCRSASEVQWERLLRLLAYGDATREAAADARLAERAAAADAMAALLLEEEAAEAEGARPPAGKKKKKKKKKKGGGGGVVGVDGGAEGGGDEGGGDAECGGNKTTAAKAVDADADADADAESAAKVGGEVDEADAADAADEADEADEERVPPSFLCPVTLEVLVDPVITIADGQTYERSAIERWLKNNDTSPLTGAYLDTKVLVANVALRSAIREWAAENTP